MDFIEKCFKLKENKTTFKTELMAGLTTFMTMAYILVVNPSILSTTGMDAGALLTATCIASALGTFFMAFFANYPFVLAPGMGLNAYFAFTICAQKGYSWHVALAAVFVEGIIFIILSAVNWYHHHTGAGYQKGKGRTSGWYPDYMDSGYHLPACRGLCG